MAKAKQNQTYTAPQKISITDPLRIQFDKSQSFKIEDTLNANVRIIEDKKTFYSENKDYIIGFGNLLITLAVFGLSRRNFKKDRLSESEYQTRLFLFQNNVNPTFLEAISFSELLLDEFYAFIENAKTSVVGSQQRQDLIQKRATELREGYEKYIKASLSKVLIFDPKLKFKLLEISEGLNDKYTSLTTSIFNKNLNPKECHQLIQQATSINESFVSSFVALVKAEIPVPHIK